MSKSFTILCAILFIVACTENSPTTDAERALERTPIVKPNSPVIVSLSEANTSQIEKPLTFDEATAIVINDRFKEFDTSAIKANKNINSRILNNVGIKATGTSQITQRVFHMAGQIAMYSTYEYDTTGIRTRRITYNGVGVDTSWFTTDDVIRNYAQFHSVVNQLQTHYINYNNAGTDGLWFTEDDTVSFYMADLIDASGAVIATAHYDTAGIDTIWFNTDDTIKWIYTDIHNPDGSSEWVQYKTAGVDLDWLTLNDNNIGHFSKKTVNAAGKTDQHVFYIGPGVDALAFTADDVVGFYHDYTYDAENFLTNTILYRDGPGADAIWFSADDVASKCIVRDKNPDGTVNLFISYLPGVDTVCFTADDVVNAYMDHTYDTNGHLISANTYIGSGTDATWFTPDDILVKESTFTAN